MKFLHLQSAQKSNHAHLLNQYLTKLRIDAIRNRQFTLGIRSFVRYWFNSCAGSIFLQTAGERWRYLVDRTASIDTSSSQGWKEH